ncbi:hypothetical protein AB1Y20_013289 [Prymnesium parvum]|uniref:Uncharacterized protein n=1 Tax=Prymnesium parvum TaxID=97485 RepID=A0AB34INC0_PRYPA
MALTAEEEEAIMECEDEAVASDATAGKRPAAAPPLGEPAPTRARPPVVDVYKEGGTPTPTQRRQPPLGY